MVCGMCPILSQGNISGCRLVLVTDDLVHKPGGKRNVKVSLEPLLMHNGIVQVALPASAHSDFVALSTLWQAPQQIVCREGML